MARRLWTAWMIEWHVVHGWHSIFQCIFMQIDISDTTPFSLSLLSLVSELTCIYNIYAYEKYINLFGKYVYIVPVYECMCLPVTEARAAGSPCCLVMWGAVVPWKHFTKMEDGIKRFHSTVGISWAGQIWTYHEGPISWFWYRWQTSPAWLTVSCQAVDDCLQVHRHHTHAICAKGDSRIFHQHHDISGGFLRVVGCWGCFDAFDVKIIVSSWFWTSKSFEHHGTVCVWWSSIATKEYT